MRKGFFKISNSAYTEMWEYLHLIFKDFRPTHIEFRHWENNVWYLHGVSEKFDELKEGDVVPQYDALFTTHENGSITYEIKRF
jgi:hypothetical protein